MLPRARVNDDLLEMSYTLQLDVITSFPNREFGWTSGPDMAT